MHLLILFVNLTTETLRTSVSEGCSQILQLFLVTKKKKTYIISNFSLSITLIIELSKPEVAQSLLIPNEILRTGKGDAASGIRCHC